MNKQKVRYKDLSIPLQTAVIVSYVMGIFYALFFVIGIISIVMGE